MYAHSYTHLQKNKIKFGIIETKLIPSSAVAHVQQLLLCVFS